MLIENIVLVNKLGLHIRAASKLVDVSNRFSSHIEITLESKTANAKSILNIMLLGATEGASLTIMIEGDDEEDALMTIKALIEGKFGEEE